MRTFLGISLMWDNGDGTVTYQITSAEGDQIEVLSTTTAAHEMFRSATETGKIFLVPEPEP